MIILSSDAERPLAHRDHYFEDWAWIVSKILWLGIEKFYHALSRQGYPLELIPVVVPFLPFPSTDILVAGAQTSPGTRFTARGKDARQLKRALYGTEDLRSLAPEDLAEKALSCLTPDGIRAIYREVPEARWLLHSLAWGRSMPLNAHP